METDLRRARRGVTLLELILALGLSILVLVAISMAINLNFRILDIRRTNVEEAQVARAVLKQIADDLRCAVQYEPPDLSGLSTVTNNAASAAGASLQGAIGGGGSTGAGGSGGGDPSASSSGATTGASSSTASSAAGATGAAGGGAAGGAAPTAGGVAAAASSGASAASTDEAALMEEEAAAASVIGLYGTATELRFDMSRLPRLDEYQGILAASGELSPVDLPSDVKTVVYFLLSDASAAESTGPVRLVGSPEASATGRGRGLMRSELDRAVAAWNELGGGYQAYYDAGQLLAPEVVGLTFQYFDGLAWATEWDSAAMGGLPRAVEIVITIQPTYAMTEAEIAAAEDLALPAEQTYRLVVNLPSAPLVAPAAETTETGEPTDPAATDPAAATSASAASPSATTGGTP